MAYWCLVSKSRSLKARSHLSQTNSPFSLGILISGGSSFILDKLGWNFFLWDNACFLSSKMRWQMEHFWMAVLIESICSHRSGPLSNTTLHWLHFQWLAPAAPNAGWELESKVSDLTVAAELELLGIKSALESTDDCSDLIVTRSSIETEDVCCHFATLMRSKLAFIESSRGSMVIGWGRWMVVGDVLELFFELFLPITPFEEALVRRLVQAILCLLNSPKDE